MKPLQSVPSAGCAASLELVAAPMVRAALLEDIGRGGDLTTDAIVEPERRARARIVARRGGILAGLDFAAIAFRLLDERIEIVRCVGGGRSLRSRGDRRGDRGPRARDTHRRTNRTQPARPALRDRNRDADARRSRRRNLGPHSRHAENDAGAARAGTLCGLAGRRRQSPLRSRRRRADQRQSSGAGAARFARRWPRRALAWATW